MAKKPTQNGSYEYIEFEQSRFEWLVPDKGFKVFDVDYADYMVVDSAEDPKQYTTPYLVTNPDTLSMIKTYPLDDEPTLFLDFYELPLDDQAMVEFANKHGMLTRGRSIWLPGPEVDRNTSKAEKLIPHFDFEGELVIEAPAHELLSGESFPWSNYLKRFKATFRLWELYNAATQGNEEEKAAAIKVLKKGVKWRDNESFESFYEEHQAVYRSEKSVRKGDVILPAMLIVRDRIHSALKGSLDIQLEVIQKDEGIGLNTYFMPKDLLTAIWVQFFNYVAGKTRFKKCILCQKWEDMNKRNKNWTMHESCASKARVYRSRARKKGEA